LDQGVVVVGRVTKGQMVGDERYLRGGKGLGKRILKGKKGGLEGGQKKKEPEDKL